MCVFAHVCVHERVSASSCYAAVEGKGRITVDGIVPWSSAWNPHDFFASA